MWRLVSNLAVGKSFCADVSSTRSRILSLPTISKSHLHFAMGIENSPSLQNWAIATFCGNHTSSAVTTCVLSISPDETHVEIRQGYKCRTVFVAVRASLCPCAGPCRGWPFPCLTVLSAALKLNCSWLKHYLRPLAARTPRVLRKLECCSWLLRFLPLCGWTALCGRNLRG